MSRKTDLRRRRVKKAASAMEVCNRPTHSQISRYWPVTRRLSAARKRWQEACSPVGQAMSKSDADEKRALPDGIGKEHVAPRNGWRRHASPLALAVFGSVIVLGLTGFLGHERDWQSDAEGVSLTVHSPEITRNGEFFELRITVETAAAIEDLGIGVDQGLWEDMTVNTMIPAATEETGIDGEFRFTFGPIEPGTTFDFKIDLQVNPDIVGGNEGLLTVYDGDRPITSVDIGIMVLP